MKKNNLLYFLLFLVLLLPMASCKKASVPKPRGYFRIDLPEKKYVLYESDCPYTFEYPEYAIVVKDTGSYSEPYWINIFFPAFNADINVSYKMVNDTNLSKYLDESWTLLQKHNIKAEAIKDSYFTDTSKKVYGVLYELKGNAASAIQFILTDSTTHFFRGALYFNEKPNKDSIAPVLQFIQKDIIHLIETFQWKK
ncbi:MAG: gliding motility lipoprotein GldD [Bacteroidetes bacterium GWF2_38_335]|nr:MAG: gliding motility lipoprotein GldD [Bacteroidetes bacterium GWF2_38_335]OFY78708.1 MAG: gliding motility lipoprotein GldD [Bacteroidetes bacterium RIFOXYA12_FULL_38_20]HBS88468.1 gliding motility lipoprotein GldD [Bacteroidales bacterium]